MDSKRSNAINIGLTVLPPPRTIKTAILNFDEYALNKEGIEVRAPRDLMCVIESDPRRLFTAVLSYRKS